MKYILVSNICLSVLYLFYLLIFKKKTNFKQLRFYLLFSIFISLLMPLNNFSIKLDLNDDQIVQNPQLVDSNTFTGLKQNIDNELVFEKTDKSFFNSINWQLVLRNTYLLISVIFLIRILIQIFGLIFRFMKSDKTKKTAYVFIHNSGYKSTFSFFNWIFINEEESEKNLDKIVTHEKIHADQYHSIDVLITEVLTAFMWFNPVVWMLKQSVQLVHEYLADEGVLNKGASVKKYQELLVNQVAEERLIHMTSSFNKSLIKKRIIMMNNEKITGKLRLKAVALVSLITLLFIGVSCMNGQKKEQDKTVAVVAPTRMNVLYLGIENPVSIAVSGYESSEIVVEIKDNKGEISGSDGDYIIIPKDTGYLIVVVKAKGKLVKESVFRVKVIPEPILIVAGKSGGKIKKEDLEKVNEVYAYLLNFDFDVNYEIVEFVVSTTDEDGYFKQAISKSNEITEDQKNLIKSARTGSRINFEEIMVKDLDGNLFKIPPIVFEIIK